MNTADASMFDLLSHSQSVALLGVSPRPDTPSYEVASYLQSQGYQLVPVTDGDDSVVGYPTAKSLDKVTEPVDVMSVFLTSDQAPALTDDVSRLGVKAIWVQPGCSANVEQACKQTGVPVYTNHCIMRDHQRLLGNAKA
ncbi:CoA-binding protein [Alicyclobacillus ferrooxydans]|uniref:CoA-binding domain-containing protein n=1 Tax=Alicyclobacillus ferrooxydans TaxID=471514 RepID=A0A0P9CIN9_9BACL|nr:CoA-binding protein [Alicyclobacillus ferrooxydans]KPV45273.1 hypothetical protein AN477_02445 [Alicyclobacillus ferrooxydans]